VLLKSTRLLYVPFPHRHLCLMFPVEVSSDVTVPCGQGEHCVHMLREYSTPRTSREFVQTMIFHMELAIG
jgi:hypothetical protein